MNTTAQTILAQLGGNKFLAMTGAKSLCAGSNFLQFKLPARLAKDGINHVCVTLETDDTYMVEFVKVWNHGLNHRRVSLERGVYFDQLQQLFTAETGLDTHL